MFLFYFKLLSAMRLPGIKSDTAAPSTRSLKRPINCILFLPRMRRGHVLLLSRIYRNDFVLLFTWY